MFIISEKFWNHIKIALPEKSRVGRPHSDFRTVLSGIFFILDSGSQWKYLPTYYGPVSTVHGIYIKLIESGFFQKILDLSIKFAMNVLGKPKSFFYDTSHSKAPFAKDGGKNPTDRSKRGVKKGIVIDFKKIILSLSVDSANTHDSKTLLQHIKNIENFIEDTPLVLAADSAFDSKKLRKNLADFKLALLASTNVRRDKNKKKTSPGGRWKIEQIFGILHWHRGIKTCWSKLKYSFLGFLQFAAAIHNFKLGGVFG